MKQVKSKYKNIIIGFGKGGKTLAAHLAKQGEDVAIIEQSDQMYGGTCINIGCIPTKSLIVSGEKHLAYTDALNIKNDLTASLRKANFDKLDSQATVTVITGSASFVSERTINVRSAQGEHTITGERIFINTGARPFIPNIKGIQESRRVFTSTSMMEQPVLPKKLIVIGAGFIGLEFADMFAKFGCEVTLLDQEKIFLPREDRDIADEIHKILSDKNIRIISGVAIERISDTADGIIVEYRHNNGQAILEASAALIATGRTPNIEGLHLDAAGIATDQRGYVRVNHRLETNVPNIWAIGDINGGPQFTYISLDDFRIIRDQLFGGDYVSVSQRKPVASSVFITPTLAHIGLREHEAKEKGYNTKIAKVQSAAIPRARILNETRGFLKSVVDADTNKILGCTLLCAEASEMINTVQIAIQTGMDYRILRDMIFTHPSMTEAFNDLYGTLG
jgi:pyruvate/2-oxoglutarate dehydrogenase complex dihydrolipoamide dehydrogenase (E3) component